MPPGRPSWSGTCPPTPTCSSTPSRRSFFARQRAQLVAHVVNTTTQFNLPPLSKKLTYAANRSPEIAERFADPSTRLAVTADLGLIAAYDTRIADLERYLVKHAKVD